MRKFSILFLFLSFFSFRCFADYLDIMDLSITSSVSYGTSVLDVSWSHNGLYVAAAGDNNLLTIYLFDGSNLEILDSVLYTDDVRSVDWSPYDRYLAVGADDDTVTIYSFDGSSLSVVDSIGYDADSVRWSPDGSYVLLVGDALLSVYSFDGLSMSFVDSLVITNGRSGDWHPDGEYFILGRSAGNYLEIYSFDGSSISSVTSGGSGSALDVAWNMNGVHIAAGNGSSFRVYSFDGTSLNLIDSASVTTAYAVDWSSDGKYLFCGANNSNNNVLVYSFDGSNLSLINTKYFAGIVRSVSASFDGRYLVAGGDYNSNDIIVYHTIRDSRFSVNDSVSYFQNILYLNKDTYLNGLVKIDSGLYTYPDYDVRVYLDLQSPHIYDGASLNDTGELFLMNDVHLTENFTFTGGGKIYGQGYTIFLDGDVYLSDGATLVFTDSTIIDGQGHDLVLSHTAQLAIDSNVTLTLRNLTLKNKHNTILRPAVKCFDMHGTLALDNAQLALEDDFYFRNGQMFVHNDVSVTGTSKFIYAGVKPVFIEPKATLNFEPNTTFIYNPANADKNLINFKDESSSIYFNKCSLKTTTTGIQLNTGKVYFDNKVTLSSATLPANYEVIIVGASNGGFAQSDDDGINWSGSSFVAGLNAIAYNPAYENFILAVGFNNIDVVSYDGGSSWIVNSPGGSADYFDLIFSPDGRYVLKCGKGGRIRKSTDFANSWVAVNNTSGQLNSLVYSNNLKWVVCVGFGGIVLRSEDDGDNWITSNTNVDPTINLYDVAMNPVSGTLVSVGSLATCYTSTNHGLHWKEYSIGGVETFQGVEYSADGSFVVAVATNGNIYKSADDGQTWSLSNSLEGGGTVSGSLDSIKFSPDGRYIFVTNGTQYVYKSTNGGATWVQVDTGIAKEFNGVAISPSGNYIDPIPAGQTSYQAITNSIVFDSTSDVYVLGGADIQLDGTILI